MGHSKHHSRNVLFGDASGTTFATWQQQTGVELVATTNATVRVSEGPQPWYVVRLRRHSGLEERL